MTDAPTFTQTDARLLRWDGAYNARDLGGLPGADGRITRAGALVRSGSPSYLTARGWAALAAYGIRTLVDLTEAGQTPPGVAPRPSGVGRVHAPMEGTDEDFWAPLRANGHWGTCLYYTPFLDRYPHRVAAAVRAFAQAPPGGVMVHCGRGRDRTGMISLLILTLIGVAPEIIADDYQASNGATVRRAITAMGLPDDSDKALDVYAAEGTTERAAILRVLSGLDAEAVLRSGGLDDAAIAAVRDRVLGEG